METEIRFGCNIRPFRDFQEIEKKLKEHEEKEKKIREERKEERVKLWQKIEKQAEKEALKSE